MKQTTWVHARVAPRHLFTISDRLPLRLPAKLLTRRHLHHRPGWPPDLLFTCWSASPRAKEVAGDRCFSAPL